ncbi:MAG: hypothetical protein KatS3mg131_2638 [Candidatus Tectimicrobiota bacterium]|nr:MAG: hypothetical protein KatS3mg131_2638 [Candidatus Tectomicrobia bacterium]
MATPPIARRRWRATLSVVVALLTCPCHLPLWLALLAGTAAGGWLSHHLWLVLPAMGGLFAGALWVAARALAGGEAACCTAAPEQAEKGAPSADAVAEKRP